MSTVLLVRHGQAQWYAEDYDQLSELGIEQSLETGRALAELVTPSVVISGGQERQKHTAALAVEAAGWQLPVEVEPGWSEFDHRQVLAAHEVEPPADPEGAPGEYAAWFQAALRRWADGGNEADYDVPFPGFTSRIDVELRRLGESLEPSQAAVVFTSGGPICWSVTTLLGGQPELWLRLAPVVVNVGITRLSVSPRGMRLWTFNEHSHLHPGSVSVR